MDGNISILSVCMQSPNTGPTTLSLPAALPIWAGRARGIPLEQPPRHVSRLPARVLEVRRPRPTALGHVDALEKRGDHLAQLDQHQVRVVAHLAQRMGAEPE